MGKKNETGGKRGWKEKGAGQKMCEWGHGTANITRATHEASTCAKHLSFAAVISFGRVCVAEPRVQDSPYCMSFELRNLWLDVASHSCGYASWSSAITSESMKCGMCAGTWQYGTKEDGTRCVHEVRRESEREMYDKEDKKRKEKHGGGNSGK